MLNPAHLDVFRAVLRHGGMTRAAIALGIGQPYVSRAIAQLEAELGFPLFVRGHGSAAPTREGEAFVREVERLAVGLDQLQLAAAGIREFGNAPLRIACQPSLAAHLVPRAIRRLRDERPDTRVTIHIPAPDMIWSDVAAGRYDIGLVRPRTGDAAVARRTFLTADAICVLPRAHELARKHTVTARDLADEPLIAAPPGAFQDAVDRAFARVGIKPRVDIVAQYTVARCGLVAAGAGIAIVDPVAVAGLDHKPFECRRFAPRLPVETVLIRPAGQPTSRHADRLVALLEAERDAGGQEAEPRAPRRRPAAASCQR